MDPVKNLNSLISENNFDFNLFVQLSPDLICVAGYDGYLKKVNPAVSKTLGYTNDELLSKPINDFVYTEDKLATVESRESVKRSIPLLNFENRYVTKSGEIVWLSWTSIGVDEQQLVFGIAKNITHKKKLEEDRNQLFIKLTNNNNELKQLTFTAAHDLRSPVNSLLSIFSLIGDRNVEEGEVMELLNVFRQSTENLKNTLNNYVDTLIQKEKKNIEVTPVSFTESLNTIQKSLNSLIKDSKTDIVEDFSNIDIINFNQSYLESIFLNLISNSIKYAKPNTYPQIKMQSQKVDGFVNLLFKDEGIGFDMEIAKGRVFGFNQTFHNHEDGKGIGLYLINNYLTSLGGHVDISSRVNEGTTFTLSFKAD